MFAFVLVCVCVCRYGLGDAVLLEISGPLGVCITEGEYWITVNGWLGEWRQ